jgi:hypothetical protein
MRIGVRIAFGGLVQALKVLLDEQLGDRPSIRT